MEKNSSQSSLKRDHTLLSKIWIGVFMATVLLTMAPASVNAMTQYSCPEGTTVKWRDLGTNINPIAAIPIINFIPYVGDEVVPFSDYQQYCEDKDGIVSPPIKTEVPSCSPGYTKALHGSSDPMSRVVGNVTDIVGRTLVCVPQTIEEDTSTSCAGTLDTIKNPGICITRSLFAGLASLFMGLGILLATLAGKLFEFVLQHAIVGFATTLASIQSGIEIGWSAFRDVANIVIIGMFVFTAINIILGVKEFGQKKMIAKILIIAVLINFSLLFTKMIIDASNFTAYQFYNSMVKGQEATTDKEARDAASEAAKNPTSLSAPTASPTKDIDKGAGIAARFMQLLGVQGVGDSYNILREIQESQDNALLGLMYGFLSFVFLIAVAFIFFYGAFLIVTRAILFVLLMLTSAVAFASWLIPYEIITQGWTTWWKTLIKTALFGPILMIFLWMTVTVSQALVTNSTFPGGGTLGALAANASSDANIGALFSFVLILGLLFASFKAASYFSHSISGFGAVQGALGLAALTPFGAASRIAGFAGRNIVGRYSAKSLRDMNREIAASGKPATLEQEAQLRRYNWLSRKSFDPLNSKAVRSLYGKLGGASLGTEFGKGGFEAGASHRAEAAAKIARQIALSTDQQKEFAKNARANAESRQAAPRAEAAAGAGDAGRVGEQAKQAKAAEQMAERTRVESENERHRGNLAEHERARDAAQERRRELAEQHDSDIRIAEQEAANAPDAVSKTAARAHLESLRAGRGGALAAEDQNIRNAQALAASTKQALDQGVQKIKELNEEAERAGEAAATRTKQESEGWIRAMDIDAGKAGEAAQDLASVGQVGKRIAMRRMSKLYGLIRGNIKNDPVAQRVGHAITENQKKENLRLLKDIEKAGSAPTPKSSSAQTGGTASL